MKGILFCVVATLFFNRISFAQDTSKQEAPRVIQIINGLSLREKTIDSLTKIQTIAGNAVLQEGATTFYCDSAVLNPRLNTIEAFGNVHINDSDTLHTYSQYLKYYGDDRMAYLKKDVKLTDSKGILLTQELDYNLKSGIGKYYNGGKVINGQTVLTSNEGTYYSETKDVYFKDNVHLKDPNNTTIADSLLYNTQTQMITLIGPTHSKSKDADIFSTEGTYDLKTGNSTFGSRTLIKDSSGRTYQANNIALDDKSGLAQLEGNAIIKDSSNGIVVTGNQIFLNKKNNSFLATRKPVLILQKEKDTTYIAADTLFSGFTPKVAEESDSIKKDSIKNDLLKSLSIKNDSSQLNLNEKDSANKILIKPDTSENILKEEDSLKYTDSSIIKNRPGTVKANSVRKKFFKPLEKDTLKTEEPLDTIKKDSIKIDSLVLTNEPDKSSDTIKTILSKMDSLGKPKSVNIKKSDTAIRYFLGFHHVKLFNDSLQSVCDSLFYSGEDSIFRLFKDPVVWSGVTQLTGDTIYLFTKNKKPERLYAFENGMMVNLSRKNFYNQMAGKTLNGYFKDGKIDYMRVKGSAAESVYYVQDKDSAYIGMNRASADVIDLYFVNQELNKVKYINEVQGSLYPIRRIPEDQRLLKNFKWLDKIRPKNKLELFE